MVGLRRVNPIEVPGHRFSPEASLCGFTYERYWSEELRRFPDRERGVRTLAARGVPEPRHYDRYLHDLDGTRTAYEAFARDHADPMTVLWGGMLFLTTGPTGCGKRSLMNLCAYRLRLAAGGRVPVPEADGSRLPIQVTAVQSRINLKSNREMPSREEINAAVRSEIFAHYRNRHRVLDGAHLDELDRYRRDPLDAPIFYDSLSMILEAHDQALAVILPPTDEDVLERTLDDYESYVKPRIVFFMSSPTERPEPFERGPEFAQSQVQELGPRDFHTFYTQRVACATGLFPTVTPEAIDRLAGRRELNIREIQRAFHRAYQHRLRNDPDRYGPEFTIDSDDPGWDPTITGPPVGGDEVSVG